MYETIAAQLMTTFMRFKKINRRVFTPGKLSHSEMGVISALIMATEGDAETYNVKMSEISHRLRITRPALTQSVDKLEKAGYIERVFLQSDRRATYLKLTEQGKAVFQEEKKRMVTAIASLLQKMGEEDAKEFVRLTGKLMTIVMEERGEEQCCD